MFSFCIGDVIELQGNSGTAKSELLLNITAHCILPKEWEGFLLGGRGIGVAYISIDRKFDVLRLVSILERKVLRLLGREKDLVAEDFVSLQATHIACTNRQRFSSQQASVDKTLIETCLKRVYIFSCRSCQELTLTMISLKQFLRNSPHVNMIIIDHVYAFEWQDIDIETKDNLQVTISSTVPWIELLQEIVGENQVTVFGAVSTDNRLQFGVHGSTHIKTITERRWQSFVKYSYVITSTEQTHSTSRMTHPTLWKEIPSTSNNISIPSLVSYLIQQVKSVVPSSGNNSDGTYSNVSYWEFTVNDSGAMFKE